MCIFGLADENLNGSKNRPKQQHSLRYIFPLPISTHKLQRQDSNLRDYFGGTAPKVGRIIEVEFISILNLPMKPPHEFVTSRPESHPTALLYLE